MTVTQLGNFQLQMPNGTFLGAGTGVELIGITGLLDMPAVRQQDAPRGQRDGNIPGMNYLGERVVTVTYQITRTPNGGPPETYRALCSTAHKNLSDPSKLVLSSNDYLRQFAGSGPVKPVAFVQVKLPDRDEPIGFFGRVTKYSTPLDLDYGHGRINIATQWTCPDGLLYGTNIATGSCGLPNPTSGLTFPATPPFSFGSSTGGSFLIQNTGSYTANPFFVIDGPASIPTIYNNVTGQRIRLNILLGNGDQLTVNTQSGVVTLNGTTNRNNDVDIVSDFFSLPAGMSSIGFSTIDPTAVTGKLTAYILPTYDTL